MPRPIQSVQRAFRLLEILASKGEPCGVRAMARMTDLTPPTTLSLLRTMLAGGYVHYDSHSRLYGIGHRIGRLARSMNEEAQLEALVAPALQSLYERTGETVLCLGLVGDVVQPLFHRRSPQPLAVHHADPVQQFHRLATGQALLAYQDDVTRARLLRDIPMNRTGPRRWDRLLTFVRKQGYAEVVNVDESGIAALGMPIPPADRPARFAIGLSAPLHRYDPDRKQIWLAALQQTATSLSSILH